MSDTAWKHLSLHRKDRVLEVSFRSPSKVNSLDSALMRELPAFRSRFHEPC